MLDPSIGVTVTFNTELRFGIEFIVYGRNRAILLSVHFLNLWLEVAW